MKKLSLFAVALLSLCATMFVGCNQNEPTPDDPKDQDTTVVTPTKDVTLLIAADEFKYDENGIWAQTYDSTAFDFSSGIFDFLHYGTNAGYNYWEGFIPSIAKEDNAAAYGYYSCVAKGGLQGEGTPYVLSFYSEYSGGAMNALVFVKNDTLLPYSPKEVYLCNATQTYKDITEGDYTGYKFSNDSGDYFVVKIFGITDLAADDSFVLTKNSVDYYMADFRDGKSFVNNGWDLVDLSALGQVYGLQFAIESTGRGEWGINTSTYFALDGLKVTPVE